MTLVIFTMYRSSFWHDIMFSLFTKDAGRGIREVSGGDPASFEPPRDGAAVAGESGGEPGGAAVGGDPGADPDPRRERPAEEHGELVGPRQGRAAADRRRQDWAAGPAQQRTARQGGCSTDGPHTRIPTHSLHTRVLNT